MVTKFDGQILAAKFGFVPDYCKISQSLEPARLVFRIVQLLQNLTGTLAAVLPMCLS